MPVIKEHVHEVSDPTTTVIPASESEAALTAHEEAANPHPTYTTAAELSAAVDAAINALVTGAPGALDTLNELAAAIGDDADFAGTITAALAGKVATTRTITAGTGLTGGGDLSANRTLAVDFGEVGDIANQAIGDAAAAGATGEVADAGHKHGMPAQGAIAPDCYEALLAADAAIAAANTFQDVLSLDLPAGTFKIEGEAEATSANGGGTFITLAIHDGAAIVRARGARVWAGDAGGACNPAVSARVTLAAPATVKLQAASNRGGGDSIVRDQSQANGAADKCTSLKATRVTAA